MIQWLREQFTPEQRRIIGAEAQQLLDNKHFQDAFKSVDDYLNEKSLSIDTNKKDGREAAAHIVTAKQLLQAVQREVIRKVEDGEVARVEIEEIERNRRPLRFMR